MNLSDLQIKLFMGSLDIFSMIGALFSPYIIDGLGRRRLFQVSAVIFIFGLVIMISTKVYFILLLGRVFVGLGIGFGFVVS